MASERDINACAHFWGKKAELRLRRAEEYRLLAAATRVGAEGEPRPVTKAALLELASYDDAHALLCDSEAKAFADMANDMVPGCVHIERKPGAMEEKSK